MFSFLFTRSAFI